MKYPDGCVKDPEYNKKTEDRIVSRVAFVENVYNAIKQKGYFCNSHINSALLFNAIESYYTDIQRTKCFHDITLSDEHKKAAFSIKWLIKFRPIQLSATCDNGTITIKDILINEIFAIFIGLTLLDIDFNDLPNLSDKFLNNIFYTLHFREIDGMVLSTIMYLLQRGIKKEIP